MAAQIFRKKAAYREPEKQLMSVRFTVPTCNINGLAGKWFLGAKVEQQVARSRLLAHFSRTASPENWLSIRMKRVFPVTDRIASDTHWS
jgi:hypothetical protein